MELHEPVRDLSKLTLTQQRKYEEPWRAGRSIRRRTTSVPNVEPEPDEPAERS